MYSKLENDAGNAYLGNTTARTVQKVYEYPHHNMQMVRHMIEEKNDNRSNIIQMSVFKPTNRNAIKWLRVWHKTHISKNAKVILKQIAIEQFQAEKKNVNLEANNNAKSCTET